MTLDEFNSLSVGDVIQATGSDESIWIITSEKEQWDTDDSLYRRCFNVMFVFSIGHEHDRMLTATASVPHVWTKISS